MSNVSVYAFQDYKSYLHKKIESYPRRGRGIRQAMANSLNCQMTYISQVLKGRNHFSLEQAQELNKFFEHSNEEGIFFLWLVSYARAGTPSLRRFFLSQIQESRNQFARSKKHRAEIPSLKECLPGTWKSKEKITNPDWIIKDQIHYQFSKGFLLWEQESFGETFAFKFKINGLYELETPAGGLFFARLDLWEKQNSFSVDGMRLFRNSPAQKFIFNIKVSLLDQNLLNISGNFSILENGSIRESHQIHHDYKKLQ